MAWPESMQLVYVEWDDSTMIGGWKSVDDWRAITTNPETFNCRSIGWLFEDSERLVAIAQSQSATGSLGDMLIIPRACVLRMEVLREAEAG